MNLMNRMRLKLVGLCIMALGLVALGASAAQAAVWMVNGGNLTVNTKSLNGRMVPTNGKLLFTLGASNIAVVCTALSFVEMTFSPGGVVTGGHVKFTGCTTEINTKVATKCQPFVGTETGVVLTEELKGQLGLHELSPTAKDGIVVITPRTGKTLAKVNLGAACSIGETLLVKGQVAAKDFGGNASLETEKRIHEFDEFSALTQLKASIEESETESNATLDGKAEVELSSTENWNGLAQ
jgi:hypothetical protein